MRYTKQYNRHSCAPIAILNAMKWAGVSNASYKSDLYKQIYKQCHCSPRIQNRSNIFQNKKFTLDTCIDTLVNIGKQHFSTRQIAKKDNRGQRITRYNIDIDILTKNINYDKSCVIIYEAYKYSDNRGQGMAAHLYLCVDCRYINNTPIFTLVNHDPRLKNSITHKTITQMPHGDSLYHMSWKLTKI